MIVAGIDIGSLSSEAVILEDGEIMSYSIVLTGADTQRAAKTCMQEALEKAHLKFEAVSATVATGYGRINVPFALKTVTEITCHARGAHWLFPSTRTVIDMGGQDSKVISIDTEGRVLDFVMNDKCAAGTGRFLEVMAGALEVDLMEMGERSIRAKDGIAISSMCTVFAESEVISLIAGGCSKNDIIRGLHEAISKRIFTMAGKLRMEKPITMSGGVAKNRGIVDALRRLLKAAIHVPEEPQIVGALGAALSAWHLPSEAGMKNRGDWGGGSEDRAS
ncbi:MAG: 2-hydroxyglutaryl-CoA dehydratase [Syntrophobacterales bacterium]|nr:MAG: 2-hydroxyglutaryl-CoA dehydratase [Syntrophobacterales bacterium]